MQRESNTNLLSEVELSLCQPESVIRHWLSVARSRLLESVKYDLKSVTCDWFTISQQLTCGGSVTRHWFFSHISLIEEVRGVPLIISYGWLIQAKRVRFYLWNGSTRTYTRIARPSVRLHCWEVRSPHACCVFNWNTLYVKDALLYLRYFLSTKNQWKATDSQIRKLSSLENNWRGKNIVLSLTDVS